MCFSCHIHNCLLRHSFSKLRTSGISTTCVLGKCSKRSPQQSWELPKLIRLKAQSIVTTLKKKTKNNTPNPWCANLSLHLQFQIKIQHKFYSSITCACSEIIQCHIYKSVSFQTATLSFLQPDSRACPFLQTSWYSQHSVDADLFSARMTTTVPIPLLLLWDVFHILTVPSWNTVLRVTFTELQQKKQNSELQYWKGRILKMFPEKRAGVSVAET